MRTNSASKRCLRKSRERPTITKVGISGRFGIFEGWLFSESDDTKPGVAQRLHSALPDREGDLRRWSSQGVVGWLTEERHHDHGLLPEHLAKGLDELYPLLHRGGTVPRPAE